MASCHRFLEPLRNNRLQRYNFFFVRQNFFRLFIAFALLGERKNGDVWPEGGGRWQICGTMGQKKVPPRWHWSSIVVGMEFHRGGT